MNVTHDQTTAHAVEPSPSAPSSAATHEESYNPWTVVNLVFHHLVDKGLHPVLGESGDPGPPATALLLALGIEPSPEGNREVMRDVRAHLDELRSVVLGEPPTA